ncbi:hypothetical protein [Ruegeria sp. 6PALISEP08]|nr:hypothetical protein [Ruegeria sp. 6PALISEP08]
MGSSDWISNPVASHRTIVDRLSLFCQNVIPPLILKDQSAFSRG